MFLHVEHLSSVGFSSVLSILNAKLMDRLTASLTHLDALFPPLLSCPSCSSWFKITLIYRWETFAFRSQSLLTVAFIIRSFRGEAVYERGGIARPETVIDIDDGNT